MHRKIQLRRCSHSISLDFWHRLRIGLIGAFVILILELVH